MNSSTPSSSHGRWEGQELPNFAIDFLSGRRRKSLAAGNLDLTAPPRPSQRAPGELAHLTVLTALPIVVEFIAVIMHRHQPPRKLDAGESPATSWSKRRHWMVRLDLLYPTH